MSVPPTHSALIIAVPQADPVVADLRAALDAAASWGVPAHVTLIYPFLPPDRIDAAVRAAVAETVAAVPRFTLTLARTAWFGDEVLWLAPEPAGPLHTLIQRLWARFPEAPPYEGKIGDVVPHLTVGHGVPREVLDAAAATVAPRLPVDAPVSTVRLITGRPEPRGGWNTAAEFPLGPVTAS